MNDLSLITMEFLGQTLQVPDSFQDNGGVFFVLPVLLIGSQQFPQSVPFSQAFVNLVFFSQ